MMITLGEKDGKIVLVSKKDSQQGILPNGSFITVLDGEKKFVLRVEQSLQINSFEITPLLSEMNLKPLIQDQDVKNVIYAVRIREVPPREDGYSSYIRPLLEARKSTQDEINEVIKIHDGVPVLIGSYYGFDCQVQKDNNNTAVRVNLPEDFFFHQTLITGSTGSGKTACMKYFAQYFVEGLRISGDPGAVLAINVKEEDFLYMDKPTVAKSKETLKEWADLNFEPHGVGSFRVYYPGSVPPKYSAKVDLSKCEAITIMIKNLEPEDLTGMIQNLTVRGAEQIVDIFRYWKEKEMERDSKMRDFIRYFDDPGKQRTYKVLTANGDQYSVTLHPSTFNSLRSSLIAASNYFDAPNAKEIQASDILEPRKLSVIDLSRKDAIGFGSILLRNILDKIYEEKSSFASDVPVLILIDEVHEFYGSARSREALGTLDAIARKGRSLRIGVVFASQNIEDIPPGIHKVVNSRIHFKGYSQKSGTRGINTDSLKPGFARASIYGLTFVDLVKFPLPLAGIHE